MTLLAVVLLVLAACNDISTPTELYEPLDGAVVVEARIASDFDDAEEDEQRGGLYITSTDLELTRDRGDQLVGLRFTDLDIPVGAIITRAYVQFSANERDNRNTRLVVEAEATADAAPFAYDDPISVRPRTDAAVEWSPPAWRTVGDTGPDQRTSDLSAVLQEVVGRPDWSPGNAVVLIISGTGKRVAEAFNGASDRAPLLHVEYLDCLNDCQPDPTPDPNPVPAPDPTPDPTPDPDPDPTPAPEPDPDPQPAPDPIFQREGFGADTVGGTGGQVYEVSNLTELEAAINASGPRIIRQVVDTPILTDGSLELRNPYVTLENLFVYNAPGVGEHTLEINTHDVIVTNSRLYNPVQAQKDVVSIKAGAYNILIERSTILFGADESVNSWYDAHDITFAWNIIAYPLNYADHGYGPLFGAADRNGRNVSFHHNLISTSRYRNPKVDLLGGFSMWNNVIYNSGQDSNTLLQPNASGDFYAAVVNNYYKNGPNSGATYAITAEEHGDVYVAGNMQDGGAARVDIGAGVSLTNSVPAPLPPMTPTSAEQAYQDVLAYAGADHDDRDDITRQLIDDVRNGTSRVPAGRWVDTPSDVGF